MLPPPPISTLFPYTTLFRSKPRNCLLNSFQFQIIASGLRRLKSRCRGLSGAEETDFAKLQGWHGVACFQVTTSLWRKPRSEEHTSELQSRRDLVCRLLLEKK